MEKPLREIADLVGGEVVGDGNVLITGVNGVKEAQSGEITFIADSRYAEMLGETRASAILVSPEISGNGERPLIKCADPRLAFFELVRIWTENEIPHPTGIHPSAIIGDRVRLGNNVGIDAYVVIEDGTVIGDNVIIYPHTFIGRGSSIGNDTLIYPNVTIRENITVGQRVIIHGGACIGSDGFGFSSDESAHHKIPHIGVVEIGDDVEIGANVTIDRATFGATRIGNGTKIDNLVQIGHNVTIGERCLIVAQVGIAGSAEIGNGVTLAGQAGICGHLKIGDNTVVAAKAGVTKNVPANSCFSGRPAKPHHKERRIIASINKLPELNGRVRELEKRIKSLEEQGHGKAENDR